MPLNGLSVFQSMTKRGFDIIASFFGLLIAAPVILIAWLVSFIETQSNGFFIQSRIGRNSSAFNVIKIKTMRRIEGVNTTITSSNDVRITKSGGFIRALKVDELPQLWNVLKGEMSFVGPRPDVSGYADKLEGEDKIVLSIRPGITGPASLKYKNEEDILSKQEDPQEYNDQVIWPDKVKINRKYIENYSFKKDIQYILRTIRGGDY